MFVSLTAMLINHIWASIIEICVEKWRTQSLKKLKFKCPDMRNGIDLRRCPQSTLLVSREHATCNLRVSDRVGLGTLRVGIPCCCCTCPCFEHWTRGRAHCQQDWQPLPRPLDSSDSVYSNVFVGIYYAREETNLLLYCSPGYGKPGHKSHVKCPLSLTPFQR